MGKRTNTAVWMDKYQRWQINVQKDGKRRSFYCSTPGRTGQRECNAKADAWLDSDLEMTGARVSALWIEYLESLKQTSSSGNWLQVQSIGKVWVAPAIGKKKIEKLTEQNLQDIINKAYSEGKSKKTLLNIRAVLLAFLKYCRKRKLTTLFPEGLDIPKGARLAEKKIMQPKDIAILFSVDTTVLFGKRVMDEYINAYRLQILTGLRPGELMGLKWEDVEGNEIYIKRAINYRKEITKGKNENAIRRITLGTRAMAVLTSQKEINGGESEFIFPLASQNHYEERLARYCEVNGLPHITPYELRHTFVSVTKTLPEGQIRPLVGHSKNMDTYGVYGHEVSGLNEETARSIDNIFDKIVGKHDDSE